MRELSVALYLIILTSALFLTRVSSVNAQGPSDEKQAVVRQAQELEEAILRGDAAYVDRAVADDYVEVSSSGAVTRKARVMAQVEQMKQAQRFKEALSGFKPSSTSEPGEINVYQYERTAILTGLITIKDVLDCCQTVHCPCHERNLRQKIITRHERFVKVFVNRGVGWQLASLQMTRVVE